MSSPSSSLIWVLHGPNLNRLGLREPEIYGSATLDEINLRLTSLAGPLGLRLEAFQSNHEGELIDRVHRMPDAGVSGVIINPAALTHTSVALRDALLSVAVPFYEVHLSNVYRREAFRHQSYFSDVAEGVICGLGPMGYEVALQALAQKLHQR